MKVIIKSQVIVELGEKQPSAQSQSQVSLKKILKNFRLNPRLKLIQDIVLLGITDRHLKYLISVFYPELQSLTFNKRQTQQLLNRLVCLCCVMI